MKEFIVHVLFCVVWLKCFSTHVAVIFNLTFSVIRIMKLCYLKNKKLSNPNMQNGKTTIEIESN